MFFKLALRNVRRSFRDYGVYLLTLTFGVCLFYTFNSLEGQGAMVYLAQNGSPMVEVIHGLHQHLLRLCGGGAGLPHSLRQPLLLRRQARPSCTSASFSCW